jgi:hypothetical protein
MVWYVAVVAVVNLGLGYALARYLERGRKQAAWAADDAFDADDV